MSTYNGKTLICITDPYNFTDIRGFGSDPLYLRFSSVSAAVNNYIPERYRSFLTEPVFDEKKGFLKWYGEVTDQTPVPLSSLSGEEADHYGELLSDVLNTYRSVILHLKDPEAKTLLEGACSYVHNDFVYCYDGKVVLTAWGMTPNLNNPQPDGTWKIPLDRNEKQKFKVIFDAGEHGTLDDYTKKSRTMIKETVLSRDLIPSVNPAKGFNWVGWDTEPLDHEVNGDVTFTAIYEEVPAEPENTVFDEPDEPDEPDGVNVVFMPGPNGRLRNGPGVVTLPVGARLSPSQIPSIEPEKGWKFAGWNADPLANAITGDCCFTAIYKKNDPWWKFFFRRWGCLLWPLLLLLLLLLLFPHIFDGIGGIFNSCSSCHRSTDIDEVTTRGYNPEDQETFSHDRLPDYTDENGEELEIIETPDRLPVYSGRLIVFVDDENQIAEWVRTFLRISNNGEKVIGKDENINMLVLSVPERSRDSIRNALPERMRDDGGFTGDFFVVDDCVLTSTSVSAPATTATASSVSSTREAVWHLDSIRAPQAWSLTKGNNDVIVAVLDDGFDLNHPIFDGKIYKPYNIFTRNANVTTGEGHGTHVAGLAVGGDKYYNSKGVSGVAPNCKLMPIQIFQGEKCSMMSIMSGLSYAFANGADVINLSIAPQFPEEISRIKIPEQKAMAESYSVEFNPIYSHIGNLAAHKNAIVVWAVGNSNVYARLCPQNRFTDKMINVAAVGRDIQATGFTNYNDGCNISAPGADIYSSVPGGNFAFMDGTSMAAPIVSGAIAMMRSVRPELTVEEAITIMNRTGLATDIYVPPMLQLDLAVRMAQNYGNSAIEDRIIRDRDRRNRRLPDAIIYTEDDRIVMPRVPTDVVIDEDQVIRNYEEYTYDNRRRVTNGRNYENIYVIDENRTYGDHGGRCDDIRVIGTDLSPHINIDNDRIEELRRLIRESEENTRHLNQLLQEELKNRNNSN